MRSIARFVVGHPLRHVRGVASAVALSAAALSGCYPDFQFTPSTGGAGPASGSTDAVSSTTGMKTTSASQSSSTATAASSASGTSSSSGGSSSSSGMTGPAPPCNTVMPCTNVSCCFNKVANDDHCGATCDADHLDLECHDIGDCPGQVCCTLYGSGGFGALLGTECADDCLELKYGLACDPTDTVPLCNCDRILDGYYQSGVAPAPYDQYGECN